MGKFLDKLRGGTKEERDQKKAEKMALDEQYRREFYTGKIEAHKKAARSAGRKAGREIVAKKQRGTLGNLFAGLDAGAKAFEKGAGALTSDVDLGGIGGGLTFDGFGGNTQKKKKRKARKKVVTYY